ncbi:ornithine cyclodeaminase family protein [Gulosibacter molinativorax]|uniref:Ornithine cyclodeaminase family protein n=1 Tax=Gulosibacter molinativorax TaxID=256821 RepID=A0ABT7C7J6_9MICO|nr:ornithine cyclodeaminase family protein [Gulosibacter molinativorax]MDJ1371168.1 ornithine cyclodeaminase family protein [Gulosibacter molinativorax]QUY62984.1 Ornithine cyclodeaminase [Gulosibacter molinativorax]
MTRPLYISDEEVSQLFTPEVALASQRAAFQALGEGAAILAPRVLVEGANDSVAFSYAARTNQSAGAVTKFGSVNPDNAKNGMPTISASVHVLYAETGLPRATLEATELTTIRTAAASALAVQELANADVKSLGIIGAGVQAKAHAVAISRVRDFEEIRITSRTLQRAKDLASELKDLVDVPVRVVNVESAAAANVVATCTTSFEPVIETAWVRPGATVVSVGAFAPDRFELPSSLLGRADIVVVDHRETSVEHSGSVRAALAEDGLDESDLLELGSVVIGKSPSRSAKKDIAVFVSVGVGIQDASAAEALLDSIDSRSND